MAETIGFFQEMSFHRADNGCESFDLQLGKGLDRCWPGWVLSDSEINSIFNILNDEFNFFRKKNDEFKSLSTVDWSLRKKNQQIDLICELIINLLSTPFIMITIIFFFLLKIKALIVLKINLDFVILSDRCQ